MNTIRAQSRTSNVSTTSNSTHRSHSNTQNVQPRKAKVATMAQMDISSFSPSKSSNSSNNSHSSSYPSSRSTALNNPVQQQRPPLKIRSSESTVSTTSSFRAGNNNNNNIHALQRADTGPIIRVSNGAGSVSGGGGGSTIGSSNGVARRVGNSSSLSVGGPGQGSRLGREGSITSSDDGTVSEDSTEDHIPFSGAGGLLHGNNLPYVGSGGGSFVSSRNGSLGPTSGPKIAASISGSGTIGRARAATSSTTATKPMRIAAGASMRVDTSSTVSATASSAQSLNVTAGVGGGNGGSATGLLSTSLSSSTSSSSLSWVSSPSNKNGTSASVVGRDDSAVSVTSPTSAPNNLLQPPSPGQVSGSGQQQQQQQQSTAARAAKPTSQSAAAAAAAKLAEENRRVEEAARTRRKIADLELSNDMLLRVNRTLEATNRKQAAEMQELKMRMQSAQFGGDLSLTQDPIESNQISPAASDPDTAVIIHELTEAERQAAMTFKRVCMTIEQLIYEAKQALDQSTKKAGVKVLSSFDMYEKEVMEDEAEDDDLDAADQSVVLNADDEDLKGSFAEGILDA
ncbi:hypothetical protein BGZ58_004300 [Dissophora ornata]|nr:hypothetical protein BGZ58_004300 [Dissophora ornata]